MADKQYRTIQGIVQFPPEDGEAGGKSVRNIRVRQTGVHEKEALLVSATLWPSHDHVVVNEGDVVTLEGSYTARKGESKDGTPRTYHNLSVSRIFVHGNADSGSEVGTVNTNDAADDDIPF